MTILTLTPRLDETQQKELAKVRQLIGTFAENFERAIS
jgi:hypothetical protein